MTVIGALRQVDPWTPLSVVFAILLGVAAIGLVTWTIIRYLSTR